MIRLGAPRLLPAPRWREQIQSDGSHLWPAHCWHQPLWGAHVEVGMGTGVSVVVSPALWSSNRLLELLAPCAAPVGAWVLWDYELATSTLTPMNPSITWAREGRA